MDRIDTLEKAFNRIKELESEVKKLKEENEVLRNRKVGGRKKHDDAWMESYNEFVIDYESGMSIMEIVANRDFSRRTAYRYLSYYKELNNLSNN